LALSFSSALQPRLTHPARLKLPLDLLLDMLAPSLGVTHKIRLPPELLPDSRLRMRWLSSQPRRRRQLLRLESILANHMAVAMRSDPQCYLRPITSTPPHHPDGLGLRKPLLSTKTGVVSMVQPCK
jgi:hypothetical protein